ncbi:MAG: replicative DNA helicase, partial [Planctomycetaceae bacterium]|nr:replicative DNA helicase [Planctomycetaceae bacterium]
MAKTPPKKRTQTGNTVSGLSGIEHIPPHDVDAEKNLLGSLYINSKLCDEIIPQVKKEDFFSDAHGRIYAEIIEMRNDGIGMDPVLLVDRLKSKGELEATGGVGYVMEMLKSVYSATHYDYYAKIVRKKAILRNLINEGLGIVHDAYAPDVDLKVILDRAAQKMFDLCESQTTNQVSMLSEAVKDATRYFELKLQGKTDGVETGFHKLDELIDGMHPNELIILAARPSMGKTALALNIVEHIAIDNRKPVLFVSLEMSKMELALRLICSRGGINGNKIRRNILSTDEKIRFTDFANELMHVPLHIDDTPNRSVSDITAVARRLKNQHDLQLVVIDYLGLVAPDEPKDQRQEQVAKITRRLKILARELKVPVLCLAQLNRAAEQGIKGLGHRPGL